VTAQDKRLTFPNQRIDKLYTLYDSIYNWNWDTLSNNWNTHADSKQIYFTYDANYNQTGYVTQNWNGTLWVNAYQYSYIYNTNNSITVNLTQTWKDSVWENANQYINTYDSMNNIDSILYQVWNDTTMSWVNSSLATLAYDTNNNNTEYLYQFWVDTAWINSLYNINTFDAYHQITYSLGQIWMGGAWMGVQSDTYYYNSNHKLSSELTETWYGGSLQPSYYSTYSYDANNNLTEILYQSYHYTWAYQNNYTYDQNNNLIHELDLDLSKGINDDEYSYTYDMFNLRQSYTHRRYNNIGTAVQSGDSTYYYYHTYLGVNEIKDESIIVYPNPATNQLSIHNLSAPKNGLVSISIINILGEVLLQETVRSSEIINVNINNLSRGTYFLQMQTEHSAMTNKFVKN